MKQKLLVDTDILIDVSRGIPVAINRLQSEANNSTLTISSVTQMELIVGCRNKTELQNLEKFLRRYLILKVNELIDKYNLKLFCKCPNCRAKFKMTALWEFGC